MTDTAIPQPPQQPINGQLSGLRHHRHFLPPLNRKLMWIIVAVVVVVIIIGASLLWYRHELSPLGTNKAQLIEITIAPGTTPSNIGVLLAKDKIIRSHTAFDIYTRLARNRNNLQAGTYRLSPAQTTPQIVDHLVKGTVDQFSITFLPGATVKEDKQVLLDAGFSTSEVNSAFAKTYSSPLFAHKPAGTDLEGYIYGETYDFNSGATVSDILERTFAQFYSVVQADNLVQGFAKQGLNLYQGITLASIIQREVATPTDSTQPSPDQRQVAQIFYKRLSLDMPLGSDVTFIYAAQKLGVPATPTLDSPYNTRIHTGLPPGPIAVPGLTALLATASPAKGNYLFFLTGDNGKMYYAITEAQHEKNVQNYCKKSCD